MQSGPRTGQAVAGDDDRIAEYHITSLPMGESSERRSRTTTFEWI